MTMVVRCREAGRVAAERVMRKLMRTQGILLLVLAVITLLLGPGTIVALMAVTGVVETPAILLAIGLLALPIALGVLGVRQVRRQPNLPEVAVTITPETVVFPAIERPSGLARRIRAEEWPRADTSAQFLPASGLLTAARVDFTWHDGGRLRRRSIAADTIEVEPRAIVEALNGPRTT